MVVDALPVRSRLAGWRLAALWLPVLLAAGGASATADPRAIAAGKALAVDGNPAGVAACSACHGADGGGQAAAGIPRLAGLDATYLRAQLAAFAAGTRENATMAPIAKAMNDQARADVAAYYASLVAPPSPPASAPKPPVAAGETIALRGDWGADIPSCASCHSRTGRGVGAAFPAIAGQSSTYILNQLEAWRSGARHDDPLGLMRTVATRLNDDQAAAVAAYYSTLPAEATGVAAGDAPPDPAIANDEFGKVVKLGEAIFRNPAAHAAAYVGNTLTCSNCHLDAGRLANSGPMGAAYVSYPAYRMKNGHVNTFSERLQGCFRYSMNGKAPPLGDAVLVALESYAYVLAKGAPTGGPVPGRGYPEPAKPAQGLDFARGAAVFGAKCALCHGADGHGKSAWGETVFPPLWGPDSFNWGAGMGSIEHAAGFIKANMPLGQGDSLSDQEAWDVAMFMDSHERPQDPRFTGDVATTRAKFHNAPMSMYGRTVAGVLLGQRSPPAGPRPSPHEAEPHGGPNP